MLNCFDGKRALVVLNPVSGKRTAKPHLYNISTLFTTSGLETTVYTTRGPGDATEIVRKRGEDFDIVVCRGGDGTLNETVNGVMMLEKRPMVGYIPAGSTNDLARTLHIPIDNIEAIDTILNGQPLWLDLGAFNGGLYFTYTASFGAFTEIAYATPQSLKNKLGRLAYFAEAPGAIKAVHPIHTRVKTVEGFEAEGEYAFVSVTNSTSIAGLIKLNPRDVNLNDGLFELLLVEYPGSAAEWRQVLTNAIARRKLNHPRIKLLHTRQAEFSFDDMVPWTVDGEYAGAHDEVAIENIHNAIQIFRR
ncbi:MAG: YegS/Rv2252/BmrU family lipid kinase [Oscillospiraceae bacterium]|nr:YegS/Rv2252/BmrU family lipid kinase [Oscillospiraceae bacterium]